MLTTRLTRSVAVLFGMALAAPTTASADRIPGAAETEVGALPLRAVTEHLTMAPLREDKAPRPAGAEAGTESPELEAVEGATDAGGDDPPPEAVGDAPPGSMLTGLSPWRFFDGSFPEGNCRAPRLSEDGYTALALCAGLDAANPRDEHVVVRRGRGVHRYLLPVAKGVAAVAALSGDGERFAVLVEEGGARTLHLVDLVARQDHRLGGGWREPGNPVVASASNSVAFPAQVGGKEAIVVVRLDEGLAHRAWREGRELAAMALSEEGRRVLLVAHTASLKRLYLVDVERGSRFDLSGQKGDVHFASLHPSGETVAFTSSVGGVCALWWIDMITRRRKDMLNSVDGCFGTVEFSRDRQLVLYEDVVGARRDGILYDRKARRPRPPLPGGCEAATLSGDGRYVAARCSRDPRGAGIYLFLAPEESK